MKRVKPQYRGILQLVNRRHLALYSAAYKQPVLAIPHVEHALLNQRIDLLSDISSSLNHQLVHKFSGVRFIEPLSDTMQALIDKIVLELDAEVVDIEEIEALPTKWECDWGDQPLADIIPNGKPIELYPEEYQNE